MNIINKNILTVTEGIICQQVNCKGIMGAGLAKSIRDKWPVVFHEYEKLHTLYRDKEWSLLGHTQFVTVEPNLIVCNIFAQLDFGRGERRTEYSAFAEACGGLSNYHDKQFYFPYMIGCGLGGGSWTIISKILDFYLPSAILCKHEV